MEFAQWGPWFDMLGMNSGHLLWSGTTQATPLSGRTPEDLRIFLCDQTYSVTRTISRSVKQVQRSLS